MPSSKAKEARLDLSPKKNKTASGGAGICFAERVAQKDRQTVLLSGEDSTPPKKRNGGEASEGEAEVVDKPANTEKRRDGPHQSHCCTGK